MGLEGANGPFGGVPAMDVRRWNQLEFDAPIGGDGLFVGFACFIVQYLKFHKQLAILEALHDGIVGYHPMPVCSSLEGHS